MCWVDPNRQSRTHIAAPSFPHLPQQAGGMKTRKLMGQNKDSLIGVEKLGMKKK